MVKVKYVGKEKEFFVPGIPGIWKRGEVRVIKKEEYEKIKKDKNFILEKQKEENKDGSTE